MDVEGRFQVPKLSSLCLDYFLAPSFPASLEQALQTYRAVPAGFDFSLDPVGQVRLKCLNYFRDRFSYLHATYDQESLINMFGIEDLEKLTAMMTERLNVERLARIRIGAEVERVAPSNSSPTEDGYYPIECLRSGVKWPSGVDPAKREQFLSPTDFETIFDMSKEKFEKLDKYKRIRLKKEKDLF